jgi:hypothetical protein
MGVQIIYYDRFWETFFNMLDVMVHIFPEEIDLEVRVHIHI